MGKKTLLSIAAVVAAAAGVLVAAPAEARPAVTLSIGTGVPYGYAYPSAGYGYVQPGYVYTQPSYVYTEPSYIYAQPSYVVPQPVYIAPRYYGRGYSRDRDHDGVPNRFDRRPNNPRRF